MPSRSDSRRVPGVWTKGSGSIPTWGMTGVGRGDASRAARRTPGSYRCRSRTQVRLAGNVRSSLWLLGSRGVTLGTTACPATSSRRGSMSPRPALAATREDGPATQDSAICEGVAEHRMPSTPRTGGRTDPRPPQQTACSRRSDRGGRARSPSSWPPATACRGGSGPVPAGSPFAARRTTTPEQPEDGGGSDTSGDAVRPIARGLAGCGVDAGVPFGGPVLVGRPVGQRAMVGKATGRRATSATSCRNWQSEWLTQGQVELRGDPLMQKIFRSCW